MPKCRNLGFLAALVLAATSCTPRRNHSEIAKGDLAAIEELHTREKAAVTSFNADGFADLIEDDIVALSPQSPPVKGRSAYMEAYRASVKKKAEFDWIHYQAQWKDVQIVSDYAYEWGVVESVVRYKSSGTLAAQTWNMLRILRRQKDGSWRVLRGCYTN